MSSQSTTDERPACDASAWDAILQHYCKLGEEVAAFLTYPATDCFCLHGGFCGKGPFGRTPPDLDGYRNDWQVADFIAAAVREKIAALRSPAAASAGSVSFPRDLLAAKALELHERIASEEKAGVRRHYQHILAETERAMALLEGPPGSEVARALPDPAVTFDAWWEKHGRERIAHASDSREAAWRAWEAAHASFAPTALPDSDGVRYVLTLRERPSGWALAGALETVAQTVRHDAAWSGRVWFAEGDDGPTTSGEADGTWALAPTALVDRIVPASGASACGSCGRDFRGPYFLCDCGRADGAVVAPTALVDPADVQDATPPAPAVDEGAAAAWERISGFHDGLLGAIRRARAPVVEADILKVLLHYKRLAEYAAQMRAVPTVAKLIASQRPSGGEGASRYSPDTPVAQILSDAWDAAVAIHGDPDEYRETVFVGDAEYDVASLVRATLGREGETVALSDLKWSRRGSISARIIVGPDNQVYDGNKRLTALERSPEKWTGRHVYVYRVTDGELAAARIHANASVSVAKPKDLVVTVDSYHDALVNYFAPHEYDAAAARFLEVSRNANETDTIALAIIVQYGGPNPEGPRARSADERAARVPNSSQTQCQNVTPSDAGMMS